MGGYACDMLHAKVRFALVRSIVAHVASVCAFVSRFLATAPSRRKAAIVMRTKKESDLPVGVALLGNPNRTDGIPESRELPPALVGILSPSLVGALCARDYGGGRGVHTDASRCVREPN